MELLPGALTSSQWAVKAQAARALGTVAKKLGANIQHEIQVSTAQQYIVQYTLHNIQYSNIALFTLPEYKVDALWFWVAHMN